MREIRHWPQIATLLRLIGLRHTAEAVRNGVMGSAVRASRPVLGNYLEQATS